MTRFYCGSSLAIAGCRLVRWVQVESVNASCAETLGLMKGIENIAAGDIAETQRLIDHPAVRLLRMKDPRDVAIRPPLYLCCSGRNHPFAGLGDAIGEVACVKLADNRFHQRAKR